MVFNINLLYVCDIIIHFRHPPVTGIILHHLTTLEHLLKDYHHLLYKHNKQHQSLESHLQVEFDDPEAMPRHS